MAGFQPCSVLLPLLSFATAKTAHQINDDADDQNKSQPAAAISRAAVVKAATAAQQKQEKYDYNEVHADKITNGGALPMGCLPHASKLIFI